MAIFRAIQTAANMTQQPPAKKLKPAKKRLQLPEATAELQIH